MSDVRLPKPRAELADFPPYRTQQMRADVRLHANEWTEPNPAATYLNSGELDAILLNRYPGATRELSEALAPGYGVLPEQLIFGNGSNEVLFNTFLAFGGHGRTTLLFEPTYSLYGRLTTMAGGTLVQEQIGLPYELTVDRALATMEQAQPHIVTFCTPNNPSGNTIEDDVILAAAERYPDTLVLVDEAYAEFTGHTLIGAIGRFPNIVVSRTFSKARAAAGLRVGILITHPELAAIYRAVQLPYHLSTVTVAVATRIARDVDSVGRRVERAAAGREKIFKALSSIPEIEAFPSVANFILFRLRDREPEVTHAHFLDHGVLIRDVSSWPGCTGCLRVSLGTPEENDRFISALGVVFGAVPA